MEKVEITLEACRVNAKKTQAEWAELNGVSLNTVSNWERGVSEPSLSQIRTISKLSGIPISFIIVGDNSL